MAFDDLFIVLHDDDDLASAQAHGSATLSGTVLAFDTDIHLILQQRGIPQLTPWEIVGRDELWSLQAFEAAIWRHWSQHACLEFEGLNLLGMVEFRHRGWVARLAWAAYALRRALEVLRPARVFTFHEPPSHGLDQPPDYRKMPLLSGLLRGLAEQRGIPVEVIADSDPAAAPRFEDQVARRSEQVGPPVDAAAVLGGQPFVLFYGNGTELLRQLPLIRGLREETGCAAVQLYKFADERVIQRVAQDGHFVWHESQLTRGSAEPDVAAWSRAARARFDAAGSAAAPELRVLFDNPHVSSHFDFLFGRYARRMAWHVRVWKQFYAECPPAAVVTNYAAPLFDVAAEVGLPCLALAHGLMTIGLASLYTSLPARATIGALSHLHREKLRQAGVPDQRICITGDPWVHGQLAEARNTTAREAAAAVRRRLGLTQERPIVLLCTGSFGMAAKTPHLPFIDWAEAVRSTRALGELARRRPEWAFVVKCHPRFDYPALYAGINEALPPDRRLIVVSDERLGVLVEAADAVCTCNMLTSALVEASLFNRPVMLFAPSLVWYDAEQWGTAGWPHFADAGELESELETLFSDPEHRARRAQQARAAAQRFLDDTPETAVTRSLEFLRPHLAVAAV